MYKTLCMKKIGQEKLKIYKSLKLKKYRLKYNKFLVEGSKILSEVPRTQRDRIELILVSDEKVMAHLSEEFEERIAFVSEREMKSLSSMKTPPGVVAVINDCEVMEFGQDLMTPGPRIGLEGINDPGNLGTIIRSAAWFGYKSILLIGDCVDPYNNKVIQASMGSFWNVRFYRSDLIELQKSKMSIVTADMDGRDYRFFDWPEDFCLVLGSESHGISHKLKSLARENLSIPSAGDTTTDSLNLAITASILMAASLK